VNATSPTRKVACAGILVADLFVPPLPRLPEAGALLATDDFLLETGGCAANTGTVLARLGAAVEVCGVVGEDVFADFLVGTLGSRGVGTSAIRRDAGGTSKTVVLTVAGEDRRFIHTFAANTLFDASDLRRAALANSAVFYLGGYLVLPALAPAAPAAARASARPRPSPRLPPVTTATWSVRANCDSKPTSFSLGICSILSLQKDLTGLVRRPP